MSIKKAKDAAQQILDQRWNRILPVDPIVIARVLGVATMIITDPNTIYSGAYDPAHPHNNGKPAILVNPKEPVYRQRFTLAHELGHHVLHGDQRFRDPLHQVPGTDLKEMEANAFAANLLMPESLVRHHFERGDDVVAMFGVSPSAMKYRLRDLGYNVG